MAWLLTVLLSIVSFGVTQAAAQNDIKLLLADTHATVWTGPTGTYSTSANNAWWLNDTIWSHYQACKDSDIALLRHNLPGKTSTVLYFELPLASPLYNGTALERLDSVVGDFTAAGIDVILFLGHPEFQAPVSAGLYYDVVHNATAQEAMLGLVRAALTLPAVQQHVALVSIYWMGGSIYCQGGKCSAADIQSYIGAQVQAVESTGNFSFLVHLDGPFWDGCWPQQAGQPCDLHRGLTKEGLDSECWCKASAWSVNGYGPESLKHSETTQFGIFAESWTQGSLVGAVKTLLQSASIDVRALLLVNDVPNCDLYPKTHPCGGTNVSDVVATDQKWFQDLKDVGSSGKWAVWDWCDGADNFYGDATADGTNLTVKGQLHRAQALADIAAGV